MKTWEVIKKSKIGDIWFSVTLGCTIFHTYRGFVSTIIKNPPLKYPINF